MSCNGNCKCKSESKIETVWVESEIGEQLMFAVPEESQNEPSRIELLMDEIIGFIEIRISYYRQKKFNNWMDYSLFAGIESELRTVKEMVERKFKDYL